MRKTAKNSTFEEYRKECRYIRLGWARDACMRKLIPGTLQICTYDCLRMKRWRRIHKTIDYE